MNKKLILTFLFGMIFLFGIIGSISALDLTDGIVSYYSFDQSTGTTLFNNITSAVNGTFVGLTENAWTTGKIGNGLDFPGGTSIGVDITNLTSTTKSYTFSFWFKERGSPGASFIVDIQTGRLSLIMNSNSSLTVTGGLTSPTLANEFQHVGVVFDGVNNKSRIYVNGTQVFTNGTYSGLNIGGSITIGSRFSITGEPTINGILDELGIWNRSLSDEEIIQLYNGSVGLTYPFITDTDYPQFLNFWDDNATLFGNGIAHFNLTAISTNGTVFLEINGTNKSATYTSFLCEQNNASSAPSCGGLSTGTYSFNNNLNDNDFLTSTSISDVTFYMNYSKPDGTIDSSLWRVKDGAGSENLSLISCWNGFQDVISLRTVLFSPPPNTDAVWDCWTGSGWSSLRTGNNAGSLFEESLIWNYTYYNTTANLIQSGDYNYIWYAFGNGTSANINSSSREYTVLAVLDSFPHLSLTSPVEAYNSSSQNINFIFDATDDSAIQNITLYIDGVLNETNTTGVNGTYTISKIISDGDHNWSVTTFDDNSQTNESVVRNFTIDTTPPQIFFVNGFGVSVDEFKLINVSSIDNQNNISTFIDFNNSILGWWRMDDFNSTHVLDYFSKNNITISGTDGTGTIDGNFNQSYDFDGTGDFLLLNEDNGDFNFGSQSISMWINLDSLPTDSFQSLYRIGNDTSTSDLTLGIEDQSGTEIYSFQYWNGTAFEGVYKIPAGGTVPVGEWVHVVGIFDEENGGDLYLYVNGVLVNSSLDLGSRGTEPSGEAYIGSSNVGEDFNGQIDDVILFNRTLSHNEVLGLYANKSSEFLINNFTGLTETQYNFQAYSQDTFGNINTTGKQTLIREDTDIPYFTTIPSNATITYGDSWSGVQFDATDDTSSINSWTVNDSRFIINSTGFLDDTGDVFDASQHIVLITINDSFGNENVTAYSLTVNQAISNLNILINDSSPTYGDSTNATANTGDVGNGGCTYSFYLNGSLIGTGTSVEHIDILGAGGWNYTYINTGCTNYTSAFLPASLLNVAKATPSGSITGTSPISYGTAGDVQGSESNSGDSDLTYTLYRNETLVNSDLSEDAIILASNFYSYILNTTGGQNYTSSSSLDTFDLTINQNSEEMFVLFNATSPINFPETFRTWSNATSDFTLYRNGTVIDNDSIINSGAGAYNISVLRSDTVNYSNIYSEEQFIVSQATLTATLTSSKGFSYSYDNSATTINFTESNSQDSDVNYTMYRNNLTYIPNGEVINFPVGTYPYIINSSGGQNYSSSSNLDYEVLIINQNTELCQVLFNETSGITYPSQFQVYANCSTSFTLYQNGTSILNNSIVNSGAGAYNFSFLRTDSVNYSNYYNETQFIVNKVSSTITFLLNSANQNISLTYGENLNASGFSDFGNFEVYRNGTNVTNEIDTNVVLGVNYYNYIFNVTGNQNYSSSSDILYATINQAIGVVFAYIDNSRENTSSQINSELYLNATLDTGQGDIELWYNDSKINEGVSPLFNLTNFTQSGVFNVTAFYFGNENYTSDFETWFINITENLVSTPPTITIINPVEGEDENANPIKLKFNTDQITTCNYNLDNTINESISASDNKTYSKDLTLSNAEHTIDIYCNNSAGFNSTNSIDFNVYVITSGDSSGGGSSGGSSSSDIDTITLNKINISYEKEWIRGVRNTITVKPLDSNNNIVELTNITILLRNADNITANIWNLTKSANGIYNREFTIKDENISSIYIDIVAIQKTKILEDSVNIKIIEKSSHYPLNENSKFFKIIDWIKENPILFTIILVLLIVAVLLITLL